MVIGYSLKMPYNLPEGIEFQAFDGKAVFQQITEAGHLEPYYQMCLLRKENGKVVDSQIIDFDQNEVLYKPADELLKLITDRINIAVFDLQQRQAIP